MKEAIVFKLNLLENAFDYLNCSLEFVVRARNSHSQNEWKFAIINIAHAIELLLKERLRREHKLLIYANIDKYKPITRHTKTVTWQVLIERISFILGDDFENIDAGRLELANKLRNQMVHYDVELSFPAIYHDFANLWNFVRGFTENILDENLLKHINVELRTEFDDLLSLFEDEIVYFNNLFMSRELKDEILQEQANTHITIDDVQYRRIRYGDLEEYDNFDIGSTPYFNQPCHDCLVIKGQVHLLGCDMERCPKCGRQLLGDDCVDINEKGVVHPYKEETM